MLRRQRGVRQSSIVLMGPPIAWLKANLTLRVVKNRKDLPRRIDRNVDCVLLMGAIDPMGQFKARKWR
jgi:hypothetical protein